MCQDWPGGMTDKIDTTNRFKAPDPATFASALGQAVWLMTISKVHRDLPISAIETLVTPAVLLQQFKLYMKDKQPVAFVAWAAVSDEIKSLIGTSSYVLQPQDWRSGPHIEIVTCVSPFALRSEIEKQFWDSNPRSIPNL
jgi:hemolysin-activating ACP:hemolysin acyltransferase